MTRRPLTAAALALALSGCATGVTVFEEDPDNLVYSGARRDLDGWAFAHGGFIDMPFSFVADTVLLPYTIPRTIWNHATAEEAEPGGGGGDEGRPG
jgi:uncharacterized protein YceK